MGQAGLAATAAVRVHKSRSANFVLPGHSAFTSLASFVRPHKGRRRKLVAAVVDFTCASFDDSECGRKSQRNSFAVIVPNIGESE
jgi:hypothetical protein